MLFFSQRSNPFSDVPAKIDAGNKLLAGLTRENFYLATLNFMGHQDYASLLIREFGGGNNAAATHEEISASYGVMARYTHAFLNASLNNDKPSQLFLTRTPTANRVPANMMSMTIFRDGKKSNK